MKVRWAWLLLSAVGGLLFGFLLLPLVALLFSATGAELWQGLTDSRVQAALRLSAITTTVSLVVIVVLGTPLAWVVAASERAPARWIEAVLKLPIVVPPAVAGVALLLAFGRQGYVSRLLRLDSGLAFTSVAVVMAEVFVAAPFYLQGAIAAFRSIDEGILLAARSVGAGPFRNLIRIAVPIAGPSLLAAAATSWARALGEFGATLMFAGNMAGRTQTVPLAIYSALEVDVHTAVALGVLLLGIAIGVLLVSHFLAWPGRHASNRRGQRLSRGRKV